mmetsp:Transcript_36219/g.62463  ORF Transcript_36219/g.62463 Transcript_36219/m.62463 type:complete len:220 (+) Transcript_36219:2012-2671(+)
MRCFRRGSPPYASNRAARTSPRRGLTSPRGAAWQGPGAHGLVSGTSRRSTTTHPLKSAQQHPLHRDCTPPPAAPHLVGKRSTFCGRGCTNSTHWCCWDRCETSCLTGRGLQPASDSPGAGSLRAHETSPFRTRARCCGVSVDPGECCGCGMRWSPLRYCRSACCGRDFSMRRRACWLGSTLVSRSRSIGRVQSSQSFARRDTRELLPWPGPHIGNIHRP